MNRILVITPTYNEKHNLRIFVTKVRTFLPAADVLVVDDNSPDETGKIADDLSREYSWVQVMHRPAKLGLGTAYIEGFKWAFGQNYDYIFTMDADLSHDPKYLPDFIEQIKEYDIVIGSRYIPGGGIIGWPWNRLVLSYWGNLYASLVTGISVKDCTSGFMCFRRNVLENINLDRIHSEGYGFLIELKYSVIKKGYGIKELPIVFCDRIAGKSKISQNIILEAIILVWELRLGIK